MLSLIACLLFGSPPPPAPERADASAQRSSAPSYTEVLRDLDQAIALAHDDPKLAQRALTSGLERLAAFRPKLAMDADGLRTRDLAMLALAYTHHVQSDPLVAARAMDDLIRTLGDRRVDLRRFGDAIVDLYAERLEALERLGVGSIHTACEGCMMFINEGYVAKPKPRLYLGSYRVWLVSSSQSVVTDVSITREHEIRFVELPSTGKPGEAPAPQLVDTAFDPTLYGIAEPERLMHPGASATAVVISLGLTIAGSVLLGLKQECFADPAGCSSDFAIPIGATMLGIGTAGLAGFGTVVILDGTRELRRRKR